MIVSIVQGEQPDVDGVELDNPNESDPVYFDDLPTAVQQWVLTTMAGHEDVWALVTEDGADADVTNVVARRAC